MHHDHDHVLRVSRYVASARDALSRDAGASGRRRLNARRQAESEGRRNAAAALFSEWGTDLAARRRIAAALRVTPRTVAAYLKEQRLIEAFLRLPQSAVQFVEAPDDELVALLLADAERAEAMGLTEDGGADADDTEVGWVEDEAASIDALTDGETLRLTIGARLGWQLSTAEFRSILQAELNRRDLERAAAETGTIRQDQAA